MDMMQAIQEIKGLNKEAMTAAIERQKILLKPEGSLGVLEDISVQVAGITGQLYNTLTRKVHYVFGADNGVYVEGVAAAPQEFTRILMTNYAEGGCGINVICRQNDVDLRLVDVGIIGPLENPRVANRKLMNGTNNIAAEPAMSKDAALAAMQVGFECALAVKDDGYSVIGTGEVGMGNTTTAAACIMAALGTMDAEKAVGRGAGLTDEAYAIKKAIVRKALERHNPNPADAIDILSKVGGLDIAAMVGLYLGAAVVRLPIVVDGVISAAAALLAIRLQPLAKDFMIASHLSEEPAYALAMADMGLTPILNLNMRLGEGSGCPIAMTVMDTALAVLREMHTFDMLKLPTAYQQDIKA